VNETPRIRPIAQIIRHSAAAALAATALLLTGCSAASGSAGQPLSSDTQQEGEQFCEEAPSSYAAADMPAWNSPVGWALDWYYNSSASPVELESVSLLDSHGLVLHGAIVYEMLHSENPLIENVGWGQLSRYANPSMWARRQSIPGAVIPPETSTIGAPGPKARDVYQVVIDVSAKTTAGGWAIGLQVNYRQGNSQYTIRTYTGYVIAPNGPKCQTQKNAITAAWKTAVS
jgi:hypothetical protein